MHIYIRAHYYRRHWIHAGAKRLRLLSLNCWTTKCLQVKQTRMRAMTCKCVPWLIYLCDMAHLYMWHDSLIYVTWLIDIFDMTHSFVCIEHAVSGSACERLYVCMCVCKTERLCVHMCVYACVCACMYVRARMCLCVLCVFASMCMCVCVRVIESSMYGQQHGASRGWRRACDMRRWYMCHDPFICVPRLLHTCDMTHSYIYIHRHVMYVVCAMTHSFWSWLMSDSFVCMPGLVQMCLVCMHAVTHSYIRLQIGWQRILRLFFSNFQFVQVVPGFSWDLSSVPCYYVVLIVSTHRKSHGQNSGCFNLF